MIAVLKGNLFDLTIDSCVIFAGAVGYEVHCSLGTIANLQEKKQQEVLLYIYTHVREDALQLFGFLSQLEKNLFLSLLKVNGIGPKSAMNILSGSSVDQIAQFIENEDVKSLSKLPKVGKKTAEQMILTLKGKLALHQESFIESKNESSNVNKEIISALVNLGFRTQDVEKAVSKLEKDLSLEEGVRQGLSVLSGI